MHHEGHPDGKFPSPSWKPAICDCSCSCCLLHSLGPIPSSINRNMRPSSFSFSAPPFWAASRMQFAIPRKTLKQACAFYSSSLRLENKLLHALSRWLADLFFMSPSGAESKNDSWDLKRDKDENRQEKKKKRIILLH